MTLEQARAEDLRDLSIVLSVRDHNPTILTPDFLRGSGVVPSDWELSRPPAIGRSGAQVLFKNGLRIEAKPGAVSFSGQLTDESLDLAAVAQRYAAALPNLDFQGVGINPRVFIKFASADKAREFVSDRLLAAGDWQQFGTAPVQAGINLAYTLEHCTLRLGVNQAMLRYQDQDPVAAIAFTGNFHYGLAGEKGTERIQQLQHVLGSWQGDMASFDELIQQRFLAGIDSSDMLVAV